ncbi:uncharacterized protein LOC111872872 [Cryptotermes secundus]|uniref:uncharacterized protein LOC111872872 n=1 Tax=Cryptotermes secundus TaxID=105785 RepID=UPI000CD7CA33|nr:uncharacterized protein LOC111872872 [Cryptotermes secundus]
MVWNYYSSVCLRLKQSKNSVRIADAEVDSDLRRNVDSIYHENHSRHVPRQRRMCPFRMLYCSAHALPRPDVQRTAQRGRFLSAGSETFQQHRNQTRRLVLVQCHQRVRYRVPLRARTRLPGGVLQEGQLEETQDLNGY